jgi:hypothetical protein
MALGVAVEVGGVNVEDVSVIDVARSDDAGGDEVAQPLSGIGLSLVVVGTRLHG